MNWFNFGNKSSDESSKEIVKAYRKILRKEKLTWPTAEEAITAIISVFSEEQLKLLEFECPKLGKITFKDQLSARYGHLYPIANIEKIKKSMKSHINECSLIFDHTNVVEGFLNNKISVFFTKNI